MIFTVMAYETADDEWQREGDAPSMSNDFERSKPKVRLQHMAEVRDTEDAEGTEQGGGTCLWIVLTELDKLLQHSLREGTMLLLFN